MARRRSLLLSALFGRAWLALPLWACAVEPSPSQGATGGGSASGGALAGVSAGGTGGTAQASGGTGTTGGTSTAGNAGSPTPCTLQDHERVLCVFDYDLTISANACAEATLAANSCRTNSCPTYGWFDQCLSPFAREALARCIEVGANIGIASHADVDDCWEDKVAPIISESQFPEFTTSPRYGAVSGLPKIDVRGNWNCETCAYNMDPGLSKPNGIRRVMKHYGLDPNSSSDRARVIFWDDSDANVSAVETDLPEVVSVPVKRLVVDGEDGGCGITEADIEAGLSQVTLVCPLSD